MPKLEKLSNVLISLERVS